MIKANKLFRGPFLELIIIALLLANAFLLARIHFDKNRQKNNFVVAGPDDRLFPWLAFAEFPRLN